MSTALAILLGGIIGALSNLVTEWVRNRSSRIDWLRDRRGKSIEELLTGIYGIFRTTFKALEKQESEARSGFFRAYAAREQRFEKFNEYTSKEAIDEALLSLKNCRKQGETLLDSLEKHKNEVEKWFGHDADTSLIWLKELKEPVKAIEEEFKSLLSSQVKLASDYKNSFVHIESIERRSEHINDLSLRVSADASKLIESGVKEVVDELGKLLKKRDYILTKIEELKDKALSQV